jgi:glycosyltransferase involved in cell wall biosynthesis
MRFSIVVPTYNRNALLREALEGLRTQGVRDLQVIVMDDASDPPAKTVVDEFQDLHIEYRRFTANVHITEMHESVFDSLSGDIVYILEDDNGLVPGALQKVEGIFRDHPEITMLGTGFVLYNHATRALTPQDGKIVFSHHLEIYDSREYMLKNLAYCGIGTNDQYRQPPINHVSATFVSGKFIKEYRSEHGAMFIKPAGDYRMNFYLAARKFHYYDAPLAYIGTHPHQATNISLPNSRRRLMQSSWTRDFKIKHSPLKRGITFPNISADWVLGEAFASGLLRPQWGILQPSFLKLHIQCILTDSPWNWTTIRDLAEALPHVAMNSIRKPPILKWLRQIVKLIKHPTEVIRNRLFRVETKCDWPSGIDSLSAAKWTKENL